MTEQETVWNSRIIGSGEEEPEQLLANPKNFRVHPKEQQDALEGALDTIGWIQQVIVNQNTGHIIDGHLRVSLAMRKGETRIPVIYVDLTQEEEDIALATIDPITGLANQDNELLQSLLAGIDLEDGLLADFLDSLRDDDEEVGEGNTDEDDIPDEPKIPVTQPGDVWFLGDHVLMCGDTTKASDMKLLMTDDQADMVWTDPPYNVDYEGGTGEKKKIENDKMEDQAFLQFLKDSLGNMALHTKEGGCSYVAHADSEGKNFRIAYQAAGFGLKQCLIWVKSSATLSRQDYNWQHEPMLYGWKPGAAHYFAGDFTLTTVIDDEEDIENLSKDELIEIVKAAQKHTTVIREDKPKENDMHPTMKPVALVRRCIQASSKPGEIVLDGFGGSGTTLMACQTIGRKARLMEFDPIFCDVIIKRWQDFTGQEAYHRDGMSFFEAGKEAA